MITLYIAETSKGFDLAPAVGMFFPELEKTNNTIRPRTEFDLLNFLTETFNDRFLNDFKSKNLTICSTSEIVLLFFRLLIRNKKLSPSDFEVLFVNKNLENIKFKFNKDGRSDTWPKGFLGSIHEGCLMAML